MSGKMKDDDDDVKSMADVLSLDKKVREFQGLLDRIEGVEDKKKALWRDIYENAITDRAHAYTLYVELHAIMKNDAAQHAIQGPQIVKYLERMSKTTDQLLKLADLVAAAEKPDEENMAEEIYSRTKKAR